MTRAFSHRPVSRPRAAAGFTLIEAMMVITVLGILTAFALPSYQKFIKEQKVKAAVSEVFASLIYARSEAVKRGTNIVIIPVSTANWGSGWSVAIDGGGTLRVQDAIAGATVAGPASLTYRRDGRITSGAVQFVSSFPGDTSITTRCVRLDPSGRPNIKVGC